MPEGMDLGEISFRITARADGIQEALNEAGRVLQDYMQEQGQIGEGAEDMGQRIRQGAGVANDALEGMGAQAHSAQLETTAAFAAVAAAAGKAFATVKNAIATGISAYNEYVGAVKGLRSVAEFKGIDTSLLQDALKQLEDQFLDTASASAALKNLLSRGYTLDQAINTINRLKDSAAYGRQASYDMAEAVVSATEGLKNENSILVDNAGVTKNVAKMWEDYAKAHNTTTAAMTQAQKVEAEYQGIMQETAAQQGNAAEAANTLAGAQAKTSKTARELAISFGQAISPAVQLVNEALGSLLGTVKSFVEAAPALATGLTAATVGLAGLMAASKAAQAVTALSAAFKAAAGSVTIFGTAINVSLPWLGAIAAAIGVAVAAYTAIKGAAEKAAEAEKKAREERKQQAEDLRNAATDMRALADEYRTLSTKENQSYRDKVRLHEIEKTVAGYQDTLAEKYGITTGAAGENAGAHQSAADAISNEADALERLAKIKSGEEEVRDLAEAYEAAKKNAQELYETAEKNNPEKQTTPLGTKLGEDTAMYQTYSKVYQEDIEKANAEYQKSIDLFSQRVVAELQASGEEVSDAEAAMLQLIARSWAEAAGEGFYDSDKVIADAVKALGSSPEIDAAIGELSAFSEKIASGVAVSDEDIQAAVNTVNKLYDTLWNTAEADADTVYKSVQSILDTVFPDGGIVATEDVDDMIQPFTDLAHAAREAAVDAALGLDVETGAVEETSEKVESSVATQISALENLEQTYKNATDEAASWGARIEALSGYTGYAAAMAGNQKAVSDLSTALGMAITDEESYAAALEEAGNRQAGAIAEQGYAMADLDKAYADLEGTIDLYKEKVAGTAETAPDYAPLKRGLEQLEDAYAEAGFTLANYAAYAAESAKTEKAAEKSTVETALDAAQKKYEAAMDTKQAYKTATETLANFDALQKEVSSYGDFQTAMQMNAGAVERLEDALGYAINDEATYQEALRRASATMTGMQTDQTAALANARQAFSDLQAQMDAIRGLMAETEKDTPEYKALQTALFALTAEYIDLNKVMVNYNALAVKRARATVQGTRTIKEATSAWKPYERASEQAQAHMENLIAAKQKVDEALASAKATKEAGGALEDIRDIIAGLPPEFAVVGDSLEGAIDQLERSSDTLGDGIDAAISEVESKLAELQGKYAYMQVSGTLTASTDTSGILAEINRLQELLALYYNLTNQANATPVKRYGGGGGGSKQSAYQKAVKRMDNMVALDQLTLRQQYEELLRIEQKYNKLSADDAQDLAERLHDIREDIRKAEYDADMDLYNHQKAMGQLNVKQQIEALETIKNAHNLTQEEMWDIEEKLYDLRKQAADEAAKDAEDALNDQRDKAKSVYDELVDALRRRYDKERDIRKAALNQQISELEQEQNAEDEARQHREYEENLAEKQRELRIEKSARKRREIQQEINDMILQEEQRLADNQRKAQIESLKAQIDEVDNAYDELTSDENLAKEALGLALSGNMEEMAAIIEQYTPKFQTAGEDLMTYLTAGIDSQKEGVLGAMSTLFDDISTTAQQRIQEIAAGSFAATQTPVTVNFSIGNINEASDFDAVQQRLTDMVRSAARGA